MRRVPETTSDLMLWIDVETTGLEDDATMLELAFALTGPDLEVLDSFHRVLRATEADVRKMSAYVHKMHTDNGLIAEALASTVTLDDAEQDACKWLWPLIPAREVPLCGSSVHFDRKMLTRDMPRVEAHTKYRNIDVSTLTELAMRWYPYAYDTLPTPMKRHRSQPDITDSIAALAHYRSFILPG